MLRSEIDEEELPIVMGLVTNGERQSKEASPWVWVGIRERAWCSIDQGKWKPLPLVAVASNELRRTSLLGFWP